MDWTKALPHATVVRLASCVGTGREAASCNPGCCQTLRATSSAGTPQLVFKQIGESCRRRPTQAPLRNDVGLTPTAVAHILAEHPAQGGRPIPRATLPLRLQWGATRGAELTSRCCRPCFCRVPSTSSSYHTPRDGGTAAWPNGMRRSCERSDTAAGSHAVLRRTNEAPPS